jgi:hypothetical protein
VTFEHTAESLVVMGWFIVRARRLKFMTPYAMLGHERARFVLGEAMDT